MLLLLYHLDAMWARVWLRSSIWGFSTNNDCTWSHDRDYNQSTTVKSIHNPSSIVWSSCSSSFKRWRVCFYLLLVHSYPCIPIFLESFRSATRNEKERVIENKGNEQFIRQFHLYKIGTKVPRTNKKRSLAILNNEFQIISSYNRLRIAIIRLVSSGFCRTKNTVLKSIFKDARSK